MKDRNNGITVFNNRWDIANNLPKDVKRFNAPGVKRTHTRLIYFWKRTQRWHFNSCWGGQALRCVAHPNFNVLIEFANEWLGGFDEIETGINTFHTPNKDMYYLVFMADTIMFRLMRNGQWNNWTEQPTIKLPYGLKMPKKRKVKKYSEWAGKVIEVDLVGCNHDWSKYYSKEYIARNWDEWKDENQLIVWKPN